MLKLDKVSVAGSSSVTMLMNTVNVNNIVTEKATLSEMKNQVQNG
jgi:hypothetical protein